MADPIKRIPNLPLGPIVDKDGNPTQNEQLFRQALIDLLQLYLGPEGIVAPNQSAANVQVILNGTNISGSYTMLPGTILYQTEDDGGTPPLPIDKLIVAFRDPSVEYVPGAQPVLYKVTVTPL